MQLSVVDSRIVDVGWLSRNRSWIRHEGWLCCGWSVVVGCMGNGCNYNHFPPTTQSRRSHPTFVILQNLVYGLHSPLGCGEYGKYIMSPKVYGITKGEDANLHSLAGHSRFRLILLNLE